MPMTLQKADGKVQFPTLLRIGCTRAHPNKPLVSYWPNCEACGKYD